MTYLLACSNTTLVPEPTISLMVHDTVVLSGPEASNATLTISSGTDVVMVNGRALTATAPGDAVVDVAGLHCGTVGVSSPAVCPLLHIRVT